MANVVNVTKLMDGPRNAVFHVYIKSDGVSGDLVDYVLVDPAVDFNPAYPAKPTLVLQKLQYDVTDFNGILSFQELVNNTPLWTLSGHGHTMDFSDVGGLKDQSSQLDGTGKLLLSTVGFTTLNEQGTFLLWLTKN